MMKMLVISSNTTRRHHIYIQHSFDSLQMDGTREKDRDREGLMACDNKRTRLKKEQSEWTRRIRQI